MTTTLTPRLVVPDPDVAISFYQSGLGAELVARIQLGDGSVTHAELAIEGASFSLTAEVPDWGLLSPASVGGSPALVTLTVPDAPGLGERMVAYGATLLVPIEDRPYGRCEGRLRDPFGHLWILSQITEQLSPDELGNRMSGMTSPPAADGGAAPIRIVPDLPLVDRGRSIEFYVDDLALNLAMDMEWVMTFVSPYAERVQLTLLRDDPSALVRPAASIEVADVDKVHDTLRAAGFRIVHPLTTERWGVRRFFVEDPNGNVINVITHTY